MKLFFQEYGSGKPLIILHGLLGSLDNWHTISRSFGSFFHVFALDLRNHGRSPHSDEFNLEAMAGDVFEFIDDQAMRSASLLGHSMGGKIAMLLASHHADRVSRLVVVDIAPKKYSPQHDEIFSALFSVDLSSIETRKQVEEILARTIRSDATRQFVMKNLKRNDSGKFGWKMNLESIHRGYDSINKTIEIGPSYPGPVLFVRSTKSGYIAQEDIPEIRRLFPKAEIADVDAGHWIHAEAPETFGRIVLDFLLRPE